MSPRKSQFINRSPSFRVHHNDHDLGESIIDADMDSEKGDLIDEME